YGLDGTDRVLQKTPFSFDVSVWEFFWPLMAGATLVVARPEGHKDSRYLAETIRAEAITTVHFVPSMLQVFLREPDAARCPSLRRGYLTRPRLTAEKFIPNPFEPGARLYRTGDLARYRDDGAIEYLGRLDHQLKLRGFRIELGEIESVLTGHPSVREALVVAREFGAGDVRLVAYVVAGAGRPGADELIGHLKQRLPEYMVPSAFVTLPALPLTPNGKVDRAALPEPELARPELHTPFVAPRDDLERSIAQVWCELLGVE